MLRNEKSDRFNSAEPFDFAVFNSSFEDQEEEFLHARPLLAEGATVVFVNERYDTHPIQSRPRTYERLGLVSGQFSGANQIFKATFSVRTTHLTQ